MKRDDYSGGKSGIPGDNNERPKYFAIIILLIFVAGIIFLSVWFFISTRESEMEDTRIDRDGENPSEMYPKYERSLGEISNKIFILEDKLYEEEIMDEIEDLEIQHIKLDSDIWFGRISEDKAEERIQDIEERIRVIASEYNIEEEIQASQLNIYFKFEDEIKETEEELIEIYELLSKSGLKDSDEIEELNNLLIKIEDLEEDIRFGRISEDKAEERIQDIEGEVNKFKEKTEWIKS